MILRQSASIDCGPDKFGFAIPSLGNDNFNQCVKTAISDTAIWVLLPKNGCSTIAYSLGKKYYGYQMQYHYKTNRLPENRTDWFFLDKCGLVKRDKFKSNPDRPVFAFYRDPVERFISYFNMCWQAAKENRCIFCQMDLRTILDLDSLEKSIYQFANYCTLNNAYKDCSKCDQHLLAQNRFIEETGLDIGEIHLKQLSELPATLRQFDIEPVIVNESKEKVIKSASELPPSILEQLYWIYREDYRMINNLIRNNGNNCSSRL